MNVPFVAIHFPIYESGKKVLTGGDDEAEGLLVEAVAGGAAGGIAAALTNPLDVVKTRLQTEGVQSRVVYSASAVRSPRPTSDAPSPTHYSFPPCPLCPASCIHPMAALPNGPAAILLRTRLHHHFPLGLLPRVPPSASGVTSAGDTVCAWRGARDSARVVPTIAAESSRGRAVLTPCITV